MPVKPGCCKPPAELVAAVEQVEHGSKILDCMELATFGGYLVHLERPGKPCSIFLAVEIDGTLSGVRLADWEAEIRMAALLFSVLCHEGNRNERRAEGQI